MCRLRKEITRLNLQHKYPLWYFAGCFVSMGWLKEPFSSAELSKICAELGLKYSIKTYNYYPHKHSLNYGERNVIRIFIAEKRLYRSQYDASPYKLDQRRNYRLDRESFQEALEKKGWNLLNEEIEKEIAREEYRRFVELLNELRKKGKISSEQRRKFDDIWRKNPSQRETLIQKLKCLLCFFLFIIFLSKPN